MLGVTCAEELAGFIDVSGSRPGKTEGSKMFYWLFHPENGKSEEAPLLIWLQGGPGETCDALCYE